MRIYKDLTMRPRGNVQTNIWTQCNNTQPVFRVILLDHKDIKLLVAHRAKHKSTQLPYGFNTPLNDVDNIIIGGGVVVRPLQFPLGKLPTITSIIEKQGSGWDNINEKTFFNQSEGNQHEDVVMSTSKEYEECFIMFSTMNFIKKQSRTKINETKPRLNVYLRFSVL